MRLTVDRLTAAYGEAVALRDVSLVVPDGRVVALLGPNGAGKTTLLSVISGSLSPRDGVVRLDGDDVTGLSTDRRVQRGLCHITEGRSIFPGLSVRDNLRMFAGDGGGDGAVGAALDAFPILGERLSQIAGTMSGGQQQMLALARAYVRNADLVLLDEVSMGLAPIIVDEIFEFVRRLAKNGSSLLLVEQYAKKALELADLAYVLVRGRIVLCAEPQELSESSIFASYLGADAALAG